MNDRTMIGKILAFLLVFEYYQPYGKSYERYGKSYERYGIRLWNPLTWFVLLIAAILIFIFEGVTTVKNITKEVIIQQREYYKYKRLTKEN